MTACHDASKPDTLQGLCCRVEAHGYNHHLQVYKHAALHPSQGNITRVPMDSRELHGLVDGGHHRIKELHGELDSPFCKPISTAIGLFTSILRRVEAEQGCGEA